ncbi:hypothetical protein D3C78_1155780 [compost metagenome]
MRQLPHEGGQYPDGEGQGENRVAQDQRPGRVVQAQGTDHFEQSRQHRDLWKHRDAQDHHQHHAASAKLHAAQGIGGSQAEEQRQRDHAQRNHQRVADGPQERGLAQHGGIVGEVGVVDPVAHLEQGAGRLQRRHDGVVEREDRIQQQDPDQAPESGAQQGFFQQARAHARTSS